MTDEELRVLITNLATATARNTEATERNAEAINNLRESAQIQSERDSQAINNLRESVQIQSEYNDPYKSDKKLR
jgi:predicted RNA binding protein with dsRBD fold (UPF0201 family)